MTSRLIERIGGETTLGAIADALFMEMFPHHQLAELFKCIPSEEAVEDLRALLRVLLADTPIRNGSMLEGLCPPITDQRLGPDQRMAVARVLVDCLVDARVAPQIALTALDRLYTILHGVPGLAEGIEPKRWARPRLHVV